jgi:hypothetical protein
MHRQRGRRVRIIGPDPSEAGRHHFVRVLLELARQLVPQGLAPACAFACLTSALR